MGLVGVISKEANEASRTQLVAMAKTMFGSGTDRFGYLHVPDCNLHLAWENDASHHKNTLGNSVDANHNQLIFYGELYTDQFENFTYPVINHTFKNRTSDYLDKLYNDYGSGFLPHLNGLFCGVFIDRKDKSCTIFNDRYGVKRIYYCETPTDFYFSTQARALLKILPETRKFDSDGFSEYLICGTTLFDKSLYQNISLLPGGSAWRFESTSEPKKDQYFHPSEWENLPELNPNEYYEHFQETFQRILPRYFHPEEQIAVSLTGGLDTRMILSNIQLSPGTVPCYTYAGLYRDCYDAKVAKRVAKALSQEHTTIKMENDYLENFGHYAEEAILAADGYLDVRNAFEIYFSQHAKKIAPIRVTGNYGSEIVRSVDYLKAAMPTGGLFRQGYMQGLNKAMDTYRQTKDIKKLTYIAFRLVPWYMYGKIAAAETELIFRTPYLDNDLVKIIYQAPKQVRHSDRLSIDIIQQGNYELSQIATDRGINIKHNKMKLNYNRILKEILFKAEYLYNEGMPGWLARLDGIVKPLKIEMLFLGRHKIDFPRKWFREHLSEYIKGIILDPKTLQRPYLNKAFVEDMLAKHIAGSHNYTSAINKIVTLELIQRAFFEEN